MLNLLGQRGHVGVQDGVLDQHFALGELDLRPAAAVPGMGKAFAKRRKIVSHASHYRTAAEHFGVDAAITSVFNTGMDPTQALDRAIEICGTQSALAAQINVGQSHVAMWKHRRSVPAEYCPAIERATAGAVRCEDLRPDVAWEVLRAQAA
jgi:DNA-binding transcriptional regulator YdaS (Cro superfamily)